MRWLWLVTALALLTVAAVPPRTYAQTVALSSPCYAVADTLDGVFRIDRPSGGVTRLGDLPSGVNSVEGIALSLDGSTLYAVNDKLDQGYFGTIDKTTGSFRQIGIIGPGHGIDPVTGAPITRPLNDVDALSVHPWTGELWAVTREPIDNEIFKIDVRTGHVVQDTFGPGIDFAIVQLPRINTDVDDIAIDPVTGRFFLTSNVSGSADDIEELQINTFDPPNSPGFNPAVGLLYSNSIATITTVDPALGRIPLIDVEGLAFDNLGDLYATTGQESNFEGYMWQVDKATGATAQVSQRVPIGYGDVEAVDCLSGGANVTAGVVFSDANGSGAFDAGDAPYAGATMRYYHDNGNGTFDGPASGDILAQTGVTDASGAYEFRVAALGTFFAVVDTTTLPPGVGLTTSSLHTVSFTDTLQSQTDNNFGYNIGGVTPTPPVTPSGSLQTYDPRISKVGPVSVVPAEVIAFTVVVSNNGAGTLTDAVVTDTLPADFYMSVLGASSTRGAVTMDGLTVRVDIGTLLPGEQVTITIRAQVRLDVFPPQNSQNAATLTTVEAAPVSATTTVAVGTTPKTSFPPDDSDQ